jgi:ABC-type spermidine/putrescine transport system permease subunit II
MYCNHCGAPLTPADRFCAKCGDSVPGPAPVAGGRVSNHIRLLALFWGITAVLNLVRGGGSLFGAHALRRLDFAWFGPRHWEWAPIQWLPDFIAAIGILTLAFAILCMIAAWGLSERQPWARTLVLVLAFLALFKPLLGTALGLYTLWVMMPAESDLEYRRMARPA